VLPFQSLSDAAALAHFSDGLAEDIITELARFRTLAVTGRNQSFRFRGSAASLQQIGRELGCQFLLEGSVRKSGDRVRVSAQLVDSETGGHLWAERYDRLIDDDVTRSIVSTLSLQIEDAVVAKAAQRAVPQWKAYECCLAGDRVMLASRSLEACEEAEALFEKAIALDPHYAPAYTNLSRVLFRLARLHAKGQEERYADLMNRSFEAAKRAVSIDASDVTALNVLAFRHLVRRDFALAERLFERASVLNPHEGRSAMLRVTGLVHLGRPEEAAALARATMERNPGHPEFYLFDLGEALFYAGQAGGRRHLRAPLQPAA
jgi:TolB-like protein